ncbi:Rhs-like core protein [Pectobacterium parmentieri]|uniref:Rhs-like core protein n=3 Tax=Pectobacterium parmentieri TaxID=1905730 RepID=A0A0H3IAH8_PECPM|nr:Rhs-like core protein [Pectobacterium parmentieri]
MSVLSGGAGRSVNTEEQYRYTRSGLPQDATRLTDWQAGRLVQRDDTHYQYDKAGRLIRRQVVQPGYRAQVWHYRWDSRNQLRVVDTPNGERWFYRYDPFGRRIGKRRDQTAEAIGYLWDGDQIAEVRHYRDNQLVSRRHWVHNGWELLVQQRQNADESWETDFVTSGHNGEPQAIFNQTGELRWQAPRTNLWGQRYTENAEKYDPGLAFAGQYRDDESGLCYNRFRYYDPSGGCYISPDPIGIRGGLNLYAYAKNPLTWVDPLGLAGCHFNQKAARWRDSETGRFTQRPTDPSELVNNGRVNHADIEAWANQNRVPTTWGNDPVKFPSGGFKYDSGTYSVHGHGANPAAAAKFPTSNAAQGPTTSIRNISTKEVFRTDGTWGTFKSDPNGAHIPLDGSPF